MDMRSSYGSIENGIRGDQKSPDAKPTKFHRLLSGIMIIAFVSAACLTLQRISRKPAGVVMRNHEIIHSDIEDGDESKQLFDKFIQMHNRDYGGESEYLRRFDIFKSNLALIEWRNAQERSSGGYATYGINKFADYSKEETSALRGLLIPSKNLSEAQEKPEIKLTTATFADWSKTYVTAVKDQMDCGCCWAFSTIEQLESDAIRVLGVDKSMSLSPQQLVDCDDSDGGCDGGTMETGWGYIKTVGGVETDRDYPYTAMATTCSANKQKFYLGLTGFKCYYNSLDWMINYVLTTGPISAAVSGDDIQSYDHGIVTSCVNEYGGDHAIQIVGVNMANSPPYWIVGVLTHNYYYC